jgi:hypothetical protein
MNLADMVNELTMRAFSSMREETNQLGLAVPQNAGSLSLASGRSLGSIQPNAILEVDWELYLVTNVSGANAVEVIPGWFGSQSTSHAANALVTVNPRFPAVDVVRALNQDIDDLSSPSNGLFAELEVTLAYNPVLVGYDMTDIDTGIPVNGKNLIRILAVRGQDFGPEQRWPLIPNRKVKLERNASLFNFPSGLSLKLYEPAYPGQPVRVSYAGPYTTPLVNPTDDVEAVTGLQETAHDIPVMGAAIRLMEWREFKRTFSEDQPQTRTATEIPVGSSLEAIKQLLISRQRRVDAERQRLQTKWAVQQQR